VPNAVRACTPISTRLITPCPSTSESSILLAPATVPATTTDTLTATFAPADPATRSATTSCNPARSATASAGTRPATDTRFGSWKSAGTLCETRIYRVPLSLEGWKLSQVPPSLATGASVRHDPPTTPADPGSVDGWIDDP